MFSQEKKSTYSICSKCYIQTQTEKKKKLLLQCVYLLFCWTTEKKNRWMNGRTDEEIIEQLTNIIITSSLQIVMKQF